VFGSRSALETPGLIQTVREAYVDAGRLAHYMIICATNHRLATHQSPAVRDSALGALLGLDPVDDHILYTVSIS